MKMKNPYPLLGAVSTILIVAVVVLWAFVFKAAAVCELEDAVLAVTVSIPPFTCLPL